MSGDTVMKSAPSEVSKAGHYRWLIVALLFVATAVNYIDRTMLGLLVPDLIKEYGWSKTQYGYIGLAFSAAYALGYLYMGRLIDKRGPKIGYAIAIAVWTVGHIMHGMPEILVPVLTPVATLFEPVLSAIYGIFGGEAIAITSTGMIIFAFIIARSVLALGESGHFPAVVRISSEWFPQKERSYAIGWVNSATTIGVILTAPTLFLLMNWFGLGWRATFVVSGLLGFVLLALWLVYYSNPRESGKVSAAELDWIEHDPPEKVDQISWFKVIGRREAWAFALGKFLTDPVWFLMLFWLPTYFADTFGVDLKFVLLPMIIMYLLSDVGSIAGGWLSSRLIQAGRTPNFARKLTMIIAGSFVLPLLLVTQLNNMWASVFLIGLALAGHQAFSTNLLSIPADILPKRAIGSVIGLGGFMGGVGSMIMSLSVGIVLDITNNNYTMIFAACTIVYFLAIAAIHALSPKLTRADI